MANKRTLKRAISTVCEELMVDCIAASLYGKGNHQDNAETLLRTIIRVESDYLSRVSHAEPGMKANAYFKKLREDFTKQASEILDQINYL